MLLETLLICKVKLKNEWLIDFFDKILVCKMYKYFLIIYANSENWKNIPLHKLFWNDM